MLALIVGNCVLMAMKDPLAAQQARADWRPWVEGARARAEWRADLRVSRLVQPAWSQSAELTDMLKDKLKARQRAILFGGVSVEPVVKMSVVEW